MTNALARKETDIELLARNLAEVLEVCEILQAEVNHQQQELNEMTFQIESINSYLAKP